MLIASIVALTLGLCVLLCAFGGLTRQVRAMQEVLDLLLTALVREGVITYGETEPDDAD